MTPSLMPSHPPHLDAEVLEHLARHRGDCLTVLLPALRPGAPEGDRLITLQGLFHALPAHAGDPMRGKVEKAVLEHGPSRGGSGLAIFAGLDFVETYDAPVHEPRIYAGAACLLLPFLLEVQAPQDFFVLGLGRNHIRWLRYQHGECVALNLPFGVPASLDEFRRPVHTDPHARNFSGTGPGFGTGHESEDLDLHLHHFFARVEEGLYPEFGHRLLLLVGLEDELAAFRRAARHGHLFAEQIPHGSSALSLREIAQAARDCALHRRRREGQEALRRFQERRNRKLTSCAPEEILEAAQSGRIHLLCVPETAPETVPDAVHDLWNLAAVETFRHGGEVFSVDPPASLCAILRYEASTASRQ
ncbi:MAG: hypothetical protein K2X03_08285 [Bryobacteraceae bacterium]|nr:hypothetical protein [Bryobacteraceae bacterium]